MSLRACARWVAIIALVYCLAVTTPLNLAGAGTDRAAEGRVSTGWSTELTDDPARVVPERPNVVVVMADDMRVDDLQFAPHIRKLVRTQGLRFENSFSPFPLCCPARASFLTGTYAHNHGVYWHTKPYGYQAFDDSKTVATSLSDAGYRTGFIGKYLNGYGPMRSKVSGKPSWTYTPRGWTDWVGAFENPGVNGIHGGTYDYLDTPYNVNGTVDNTHRGDYQTATIGDFSVAMARDYHQTKKPFFMYVSYLAPHHGGPVERDDPRNIKRVDGVANEFMTPARPDWVEGRFDKVITRPSGLPRGGGPSEKDISDKPQVLAAVPELTHAERRALTQVTRQRAEAVFILDQQVARLVSELKRTGEWANTVFMFTSDNGFFLGEHRQRTGKVRAHEPSLRVPFVVTGPGMRTGEKRYDPISTVDVTATILDIAGAEAPHPADGTSRWDSMTQGDTGWSVPVVTEARHTTPDENTEPGWFPAGDERSTVGLRTPRYSLTVYRNGEGELYDLMADPAQMRNRYDDPAYQEVRTDLERMLHDYKDCAGDQCRAPMSPEYQSTPEATGDLTDRYWTTVERRYGRRP